MSTSARNFARNFEARENHAHGSRVRSLSFEEAVNVLKKVKVNGIWKFCPAVLETNGKLKDKVRVHGRVEVHPEGVYYLEWRHNGQRLREAIRDRAEVLERAYSRALKVDPADREATRMALPAPNGSIVPLPAAKPAMIEQMPVHPAPRAAGVQSICQAVESYVQQTVVAALASQLHAAAGIVLEQHEQSQGQEFPAKKSSGQAIFTPQLCYAFLRDGGISTACQGRRERIELGYKVNDFAVSADGSKLVLQKGAQAVDSGKSRSSGPSLVVIFLKEKREATAITIDPWGQLYATCGTVVLFKFGNSAALDTSTSTLLQIPPYQYFRCSSDRRSIVGWTEQDDTERAEQGRNDFEAVDRIPLRTGLSGQSTLDTIAGPLTFDISPSGKFVSYFTLQTGKPSRYQICVAQLSGARGCVPDRGERISVANDGDVIFWSADDAVSDVKYWRPGGSRTVLLEKKASNPQWITPEAAAALHELNSRRVQGYANHP